ncbi:MAG TPA: DUF4180 domain-containing protein [Rhizomicrobium sp.]|jgi:hypothetical protein
MADEIYELQGVRIYEVAREGALLKSERDATDIIGAAFSERCSIVMLPVERLGHDFFHLKTRIAGEMLQKFVTYGFRVAVIGDIAEHVRASDALRDFVYESNRGKHIWFVANIAELEEKLKA